MALGGVCVFSAVLSESGFTGFADFQDLKTIKPTNQSGHFDNPADPILTVFGRWSRDLTVIIVTE